MAERPDFDALAHAIALAAGRMAHGSTPVQSVADRLALDLAAAWRPAPFETRDADDEPATIDTPAQHLTWATELLDQMSDAGMDHRQSYAVSEALGHLRRAAELISDEVWADAPAGVLEDERGDLVVCDACWSRRGGGGAPPDDCPECGGRGMVPAPEKHGSGCASDPIGCVCGLAERQSEEDERQNAPDQRRTVSVTGTDVVVGDAVPVGESVFIVTDIDTRDAAIRLFSIAGSDVLLAAGRLQTIDVIPRPGR